MKLITWNIQWGLGADGRVDLKRIVDTALAMADFDVLCLQEVSRNYPGLESSGGDDQFAQLAGLLPGHHAIEGIAVDRFTHGLGRQQFGNMIFTRFAPLQVLRHLLPWPADPAVPTMQRIALEAVVEAPSGALRITTTHLEYYSAAQRVTQIEALRRIQADAASHSRNVEQPQKAGGPFESRPRNGRGILTGDFNCPDSDPLIGRLQEPFGDETPRYRDAWDIAQPGKAHAPTVGLFDQVQWEGRTPCFDFIFVSEALAPLVRRVEVNSHTNASDHQPILLEIDA
jgi:endonuclease/exonuclease/phosphatase family metal-dependent hydrolase